MKAYKLFMTKKSNPNCIFPLFVDANTPTPIGEWIVAKEGEQTKNGKVKSKLGPLCFRPGWHCSDLPYVTHIGEKDEDGKIAYMKDGAVWAEVEYADSIDYTEQARACGSNKSGKIVAKNSYLKSIPTDGFYRYKTSPLMTGEWIISGAIKVNRLLDDQEVIDICAAHGLKPLPRRTTFAA